MAPKSIFSSLVREVDGTWSTAYGTFNLKSALQPIFRRTMNGALDIDSFEGLVRPHRNGEPVTPGEFFSLVAPEDIENIDSILRTIHILNTGRLNRSRARVFVNFHPGLFQTPAKMRQEVERMRLTAHEAGMTADRIVCEISEKKVSDTQMVADFAYHMHDIGFRVALDDYGAGDSDIDRVKLIKPDYVKFEAGWVRDFMQNSGRRRPSARHRQPVSRRWDRAGVRRTGNRQAGGYLRGPRRPADAGIRFGKTRTSADEFRRSLSRTRQRIFFTLAKVG